jgi:hypothetical protein
MTSGRYLLWAGASAVVAALLVIFLAVVVDPYRMFATPPIPGWTAAKPRIYQQASLAKTYALERVAPTTLLLGNSRVEVGFDPSGPSWPAAARPVFNAALAGRGLFLALRLLEDDIALHPPRRVIVGVDFPDFLEDPSSLETPLPPITAEDRRLLVDRAGQTNPARPLQVWKDRLTSTLTIGAVIDSLETLADQDPRTSATMTPLGYNPLREYRAFVARNGYHALFEQKNAEYERAYRHVPHPDYAEPQDFAAFRWLMRIIKVAGDHDIALVLVVYPYHDDFLEMLHRLGLWSSFEAWKRALVRVVAGETARPASVKIYDFSGYSAISAEAVPPAGDTHSQMRWYWEAGHFKAALGDLMIRRIYGSQREFGVRLDPADIDKVLNAARIGRDRYLAEEGMPAKLPAPIRSPREDPQP